MKWCATFLVLLLLPAFASEEKDEKKALEAQAKDLIEEARELEKSGKLVEAHKTYASSQAFWETKEAEKAIRHIDEEILRRIQTALKQAHQLYDQGQFKQAIEKLQVAQQLGKSSGVLSYNLAVCYQKSGDSATALGYLDQAILATADPKRTARLKQLRTLWITGQQAKTFRDAERDHILNLNRLMDNIGFDASVEEAAPALNQDSSDPPSSNVAQNSFVPTPTAAHSHAGAKSHRSSNLCQALEGLKGTAVNSPAVTFDLANCAQDNDRLEEAIGLLQQYLRSSPTATDATRVRLRIAGLEALLHLPDAQGSQVRALHSAAVRSIAERKFDRALDELQKASTVAPNFAPTQWRLALMQEAMGNVGQAREYFARYRQLETNGDAQAEADIHLETLNAKREKYDEEVDAAGEIVSDLLNRAMNLTFNGMDDRASLYRLRERSRKDRYHGDKKKLKRVGGFGVPFAYAQQELSDAGTHLSTALGLFPLGAEANELMGLVFLQANDGRSAMRSFDAVASQNVVVAFYAEMRGHKKDHAVKCELTHDRLRLIFLSSYDKKGKPIPPDQDAGDDGLGDLVVSASTARKTEFDSLTLTPEEIKRVETKNGQLLLKLAKEDITLSPIYMPALTPTEGPAGRRFANTYTRLFVRYPGLEDSKLGAEGMTAREKMKLAWDIANAGLDIASSVIAPVGAIGDAQTFFEISKEIHDTAKSLHVNFASWERAMEDQYEFENGNPFKAIPVESASASFLEELK